MILVTVGTQLPFDRLVRSVDMIAQSLPAPVYGQIGRGTYSPVNFQAAANIPASEFDDLMSRAKVIVAHAGIGTVLTAEKLKKPIVLFPRQTKYLEHRNDHQLATARQLQNREGITVVFEECLLAEAIRNAYYNDFEGGAPVSRYHLKESLRHFILTGKL